MLTVSEVARLAGVTVRTLHHYDRIGLVPPSARSRSGYRLYDDADLERLQEVLFYRELGFGLDRIRELARGPDHDRGGALRHQRTLLAARRQRLDAMIDAVDAALDAHGKGVTMTREEMFEVFGDEDPSRYEAEVEERWSGPLLEESKRRTRTYDKEQWQAIKDEGDALARAFADTFEAGHAASSPEATHIAERHRLHIDRWFYPCSRAIHVGLADMYVADARFTDYWDRHAVGLAAFVKAAIEANGSASGG